ncbi:MAG: response regulator [Desulfobacterales bacterium]|nr:response regulator [Desulfobacterales bacterium]
MSNKKLEIQFILTNFDNLNHLMIEIENNRHDHHQSDSYKKNIALLKNQKIELAEKINMSFVKNECNNLLTDLFNCISLHEKDILLCFKFIKDIEKKLEQISFNLDIEIQVILKKAYMTDIVQSICIILVTCFIVIILHKDNKKQRELVTELSTLNSTKDKFFSIISHDLRSPFNSILGLSDILCQHFDTFPIERTKQYIHNIHQASKNTYELLENLLEWSSLQRGTLQPNIQPILVNDIANDVIQLLSGYANQKRITLSLYSENISNLRILADPNMVHTVLRNLVTNAIKFTQVNGSVFIRVSESVNFVSIRVEDHGTGIDQHNIEKVFKADSKLSTLGTQGEKGTGLGLMLCKELIDINNGHIQVESKLGVGTTFTIDLPKYDKLDSTTQQKEATQEITDNKDHIPVSLKILVVEDNIFNQEVIKVLLEHHQLTILNNGKEAVNLLENNSFDVILMDIQMPEMDGFTATKLIRDTNSMVMDHKIPIIAMTAYAMKEDKDLCLNSGMDGYLSKPVSLTCLNDELKRVLKLKKA